MAKKPKSKDASSPGLLRRLWRWIKRLVLVVILLVVALVVLFRFVNPPTTITMFNAWWALGSVRQNWVPLEDIAPIMPRAIVAAEDARFCQHVGFDIQAIRAVIEEGSGRGASTLSQQTAKNVYLWQKRGWGRKSLEAGITLLIELIWPKARIIEVYMNVAEFDTGVFGVDAAARHHFGVSAGKLSARQAAALAAVLPNPKARSAIDPTPKLQRRAASILDGARTLAATEADDCFQVKPAK